MADPMKLLVADDVKDRLDGWMRRLNDVPEVDETFGGDIVTLTGEELAAEIDELSKRRAAARGGEITEGKSEFDSASLVIVDYDLTNLRGHSNETGVGVAYLARCFSDCGFIAALNQFGENPFDLSGLGDYAGFADLDLGSDQLDNAGLWTTERQWPTYRPWAWPVLPSEITRLRTLTDQLEKVGLGAPVLKTLGLSEGLVTAFAPEVAAPLGAAPDDATFETLLAESSMGLRPGDVILKPRRRARAAAARASQWLERWILAGQDRLVDAPHLAARFPSLIVDEQQVLRNVDHHTPTGLDDEALAPHRFAAGEWLSRPAWWGPAVAVDERVAEVADPWSAPDADRVFCEDVCDFAVRSEATAYRVEVPADSRLRYVRHLDDVSYRPVSNFATT